MAKPKPRRLRTAFSEVSERPLRSRPDYSAWLTKQQAADAIGVSTKTVEKLAHAKQIQQAVWQRPTGGPHLVVFEPDDVARLAREKHPEARPFVMPAATTAPGALAVARPTGDAAMRTLASNLAVIAGALAPGGVASAENSQKPSAIFLTLPEAAMFTGLTQAYLRRLIAAGKLEAIRDVGWRLRRRDLEQL